MRLGLLADIHEDAPRLRVAIDRLRALGADRLIVLGDVFDRGPGLDEAVALLDDAGAVGVWGNHDAGFCLGAPLPELVGRHRPGTLAYMSRLLPRLEVEGCLFCHIEPWLDPSRVEDLWWCGDHPDTPGRVAQSFDAVPHRLVVIGHIHRWVAAYPGVVLAWHGEGPLSLDPARRHFLAIHAVADGWAALLDTTAGVVLPIRLDGPPRRLGG